MRQKLTNSVVKNVQPSHADYFVWDSEVIGFGLKVCKGGRKVYVCKYTFGSGRVAPSRRMTLGAVGSPWTLVQAREEARKLLGRVALGEDPAKEKQDWKNTLTMSELCDEYLQHGVGNKKASTIATDNGRIERHIKPLLGRKKITEVNRADVKKFLQDVANGKTAIDVRTKERGRAIVRGGKGAATRTVGLLGGIFTYAIDRGLISENPVRGVKRYSDSKGERYLNKQELSDLMTALELAEKAGENQFALAVIKLLLFTGARRGEIESLKWSETDLSSGYLKLSDSKTGQKAIPLNQRAIEILRGVPKISDSDYVFPAMSGERHYQGTPKVWRRIRSAANIENVRLHDLRHNFASLAVSNGASLPLIGAILGHADPSTTNRYAHIHDDPLRSLCENVGETIQSALKV